MSLAPMQERFVDEYLIDLNQTQAAIRAGYSPKTAHAQASRLLTNVKVQNAIQERAKNRMERTEVTQDDVIRQLCRLAFSDIRKIFDDDGKLKDITDLDDDTAACIAGVDVFTEYGGNNDECVIGYTKKYKFADKARALEMLGRHFQMFTDKLKLDGIPEIKINYDYGD